MKSPTPHADKLQALLRNDKLPNSDRERIKKAIERHQAWLNQLADVRGSDHCVKEAVDLLNKYRTFLDLDVVFDSSDDFLYRQKGRLKTDQNFTISKRLYLRASFDPEHTSAVDMIEANLGYLCAEGKTNPDKTMVQEACAPAHDVKTAVPGAKRLLLCEWLDITPISTAGADVDEAPILRKAKRLGSQVRSAFATSAGRAEKRSEYAAYLGGASFRARSVRAAPVARQSIAGESGPGCGRCSFARLLLRRTTRRLQRTVRCASRR